MARILIIDDEPGIRATLASILEDEKYQVYTAEDALIGLEILQREPVNLIFLDVLLPKLGGMEALERIRKDWPLIEVVVISGHANVDMAVRAVKLGAFDFLEKPLSLDKVLTVCRNALTVQTLKEENRDLKERAELPREEIIGSSGAIRKVKELIRQAAASDARILISGENGTGKELVARAVHTASSRAGRPFVEVNCAAIPDTLIESELFGHEKGAFTDAISGRKGRFEAADGGTLFLDEIGDMSLTAQAKVLRAIQEQKIERIGGEKTIDVDVRIVAASNKDLEKECEEGRFRQDLFFRLNVIPIYVPALRERPEDISMLLHHFLKGFEAGDTVLDRDSMDFLGSYPWPGNVRELKNLAERIAVIHGNGKHISLETVQDLLRKVPGFTEAGQVGKNEKKENLGVQNTLPRNILETEFNNAKELFEKAYVEYHLAKNGYVVSRAAESMGIYPSNLHAKLKKYGIRTER